MTKTGYARLKRSHISMYLMEAVGGRLLDTEM
jgi:hypothetical protein